MRKIRLSNASKVDAVAVQKGETLCLHFTFTFPDGSVQGPVSSEGFALSPNLREANIERVSINEQLRGGWNDFGNLQARRCASVGAKGESCGAIVVRFGSSDERRNAKCRDEAHNVDGAPEST